MIITIPDVATITVEAATITVEAATTTVTLTQNQSHAILVFAIVTPQQSLTTLLAGLSKWF